MRVLMVSDVYFPRVNGVSSSIESFRCQLAVHGIEVRLVVPRYGDEAEEDGVVRVPGRALPGDPEDRLVGWRAMCRAVDAAAEGCDLIHIQTPFTAHYAGIRVARRRGLPVIATYHTLFEEMLPGYIPFLPEGFLKWVAREVSRRQGNGVDALIVPSTAMQTRLLEYGVETPLHILPTGIPVSRFAGGDGRAFRRKHGILSTRPVALFVGRISPEKNIGFLLDALVHARRMRPDILLVIAGEGPAMEGLQVQVKALGLRDSVQFIGYLDRHSELPGCYAAADAFVFASRTETQGLVLLEAMAAGLPVIALAEMGTKDILAPGRGCISPPADPVAFGETLGHFFNRPSAWSYLRDEAPEYAETWSAQAMSSRLAVLYRQLATPVGVTGEVATVPT